MGESEGFERRSRRICMLFEGIGWRMADTLPTFQQRRSSVVGREEGLDPPDRPFENTRVERVCQGETGEGRRGMWDCVWWGVPITIVLTLAGVMAVLIITAWVADVLR